ncbi:MAG: glycosyltransferase family 39 protein [Pseudomonadota bacterium]
MTKPMQTAERRWLIAALLASVFSAGWTLFIASQANFLWEETHFRILGRVAEWGYPDTPLGAPLISALSETLFGQSRLGTRLINWALSALLPLAVWFLAEPLVGRRRAFMAATLAALVPPLANAGVYAYPEGPMQLLAVLFLGALIRAIRTDRIGWWVMAGAVCALGVMYYYRFWFAPLAVLVFLLADREGRTLWTRPSAWLGGSIALFGLAPSLIDNLLENWAPVQFHLTGRQDWAFWPRAALYPFEQAGLVTPILFALLAGGLVAAFLRWRRRGDSAAGLIFIAATALWAPFFVLAFFDRDYLLHWPFMAYAVVLPYAPLAAQAVITSRRTRRGRTLVRAVLACGAGLAVLSSLALGANALVWSQADRFLPVDAQHRLTGGDLEDWSRLKPAVQSALIEAGPDAVLVGRDHITTAQMQIALPGRPAVYVLDHPDDASRRYQDFRAARGQGEADLIALPAGQSAVIVLREPSYLYRDEARVAVRERLCALFDDAQLHSTVDLTPGRIQISVFTARRSGRAPDDPAPDLGDCAFIPYAVIEQPEAGAVVSGERPIHGVAAHPDRIRRVDILIDDEAVAFDPHYIQLPGHTFPAALDFDPAYPRIYWDVIFDYGAVEPGRRRMSLRLTTHSGEIIDLPARTIYVRGD